MGRKPATFKKNYWVKNRFDGSNQYFRKNRRFKVLVNRPKILGLKYQASIQNPVLPVEPAGSYRFLKHCQKYK